MYRSIEIVAADRHRLKAWRADPDGVPRGGVVVLHAIYGLTSHIGDVCSRWASAGYTAVAPQLYDRIGEDLVFPYDGEGPAAGTECYGKLEEPSILADITACAAALPTGVPRIISGFCTGGTWAWVAAAKQCFDAQVNFYGSHVFTLKLAEKPQCPTVMHYGDSDHIAPLADIEAIRAAHPDVLVHVYPGGGHAFFNPEQNRYHAANAEHAWANSLAFLDSVLPR
jgi:carboxymethylenebutenolidase